jgi:hypothetical protein
VTGEGIKDIEYKDAKDQGIYKWENRKIQVFTRKNRKTYDSADYVIMPYSPGLNLERNGSSTFILTGNTYFYDQGKESISLSEDVWMTSVKGAFTSVP